jgi:hypothetical protein
VNETGPLLFLGAAPTTGLSYGYLIPGIPPWPGRAVVLLIEPPKTSRPFGHQSLALQLTPPLFIPVRSTPKSGMHPAPWFPP